MSGGRRRSRFEATAPWALLLLAAASLAYSVHRSRTATAPPPEPGGAWIEMPDMRVAAWALEDADTARRVLGFDIRGAGLLPVRLALENRGTRTARLNPPQTFLIDAQGLAWPLLTADQARNRLAEFLGWEKTTGSVQQWTEAAPILTGFALVVFAQEKPDVAGTGGSGWLERLLGSQRESPENQSRRDLMSKFLRNPPLPPGGSALSYLFFPGRDEARGAEALRLALELDGRVQVARIPLAPAVPAVDQSRPIAR